MADTKISAMTALGADASAAAELPIVQGGANYRVTTAEAVGVALAVFRALTPAADRVPYYTASNAAALATLTAVGRAIIASATTADVRAGLGLTIGTDVQAYDAQLANLAALTTTANLEALANLVSAADKIGYFTGSGTAALTDFTAAARSLLAETSLANQLAYLGGGLSPTGSGGLVRKTGPTLIDPALGTPASGNLSNCTGLTVAGGGTGGTTAATARANLGVTNVRQIQFTIGDGSNAITAGMVAFTHCAYGGTITRATVESIDSAGAALTGSVSVDLWKHTGIPTNSNSITASAPVALSSASSSVDSTLTGWTTTITARDRLIAYVDSATTVKQIIITLEVTVTGA